MLAAICIGTIKFVSIVSSYIIECSKGRHYTHMGCININVLKYVVLIYSDRTVYDHSM